MARRRKLVAGIAAVVLVAGVATGVALAHNNPVGANSAPRLVEGKSLLVASAAYLGIPLRTLKGYLHSGHPLAAIARSTPGRTVAGLNAALFHDAVRTTGVVRANYAWLHRRIDGYVAGTCPLRMSSLDRLLGTCPGMSMR